MKKIKKLLLASGIILFLLLISGTAILSLHAVDNSLTKEDRRYIPMYLAGIDPLPQNRTYAAELNFIRAVQKSVLGIASENEGLPEGRPREPKNVYQAKRGVCYDRSRVIEKILRYSGFETRHVFILSSAKPALLALLSPDTSSHAVTEVLTQKGWLIVDSGASWVSTDKNDQPVPMQQIHLAVENSEPVQWSKKPPTDKYLRPFSFVYGLYSRHGQFYPPYNFIPDIHYGEFLQNISSN